MGQNGKTFPGLRATSLAAAVCLMAWAPSGAWANEDEGLPADQIISAIQTAVEAHPGRIQDVEVDDERGQVIIEVTIRGEDGRRHKVKVDAQGTKVLQ